MADSTTVKGSGQVPKYRKILTELQRRIATGDYQAADRLPSENDLGAEFDTSRLTVQRALKELQILGLVERKAGSGTYVKARAAVEGRMFGLLIPGLGETEIFEPICQGMAMAGSRHGDALLWGDTSQNKSGGGDPAHLARRLCSDYTDRGVSGVFFAPIEGVEHKDEINLEIVSLLERAAIPLVLLDRCIHSYPRRSRFDLVGIDNRRAGCVVTQHLLAQGAHSLVFLARRLTAPTVDARIRGFLDALQYPAGAWDRVVRSEPGDRDAIARIMNTLRPDGFVCANDATAAHLMHALDHLGYQVPEQVRIVGIDDVRYAKVLRVPLTTLRQPCQQMGEVAFQVMLSRIAQPDLPARDVLLDCQLVVRESCGAAAGSAR